MSESFFAANLPCGYDAEDLRELILKNPREFQMDYLAVRIHLICDLTPTKNATNTMSKAAFKTGEE